MHAQWKVVSETKFWVGGMIIASRILLLQAFCMHIIYLSIYLSSNLHTDTYHFSPMPQDSFLPSLYFYNLYLTVRNLLLLSIIYIYISSILEYTEIASPTTMKNISHQNPIFVYSSFCLQPKSIYHQKLVFQVSLDYGFNLKSSQVHLLQFVFHLGSFFLYLS